MSDTLFTVTLVLVCCSVLSSAQNKGGGGGGGTVELWCVAKNNAADSALQTAIDWACGPGGADCGPIQQGGPCYDPSDIQKTASYAFNDYFLKHGMTEDSCFFDNTAALTSLNPSKMFFLNIYYIYIFFHPPRLKACNILKVFES